MFILQVLPVGGLFSSFVWNIKSVLEVKHITNVSVSSGPLDRPKLTVCVLVQILPASLKTTKRTLFVFVAVEPEYETVIWTIHMLPTVALKRDAQPNVRNVNVISSIV